MRTAGDDSGALPPAASGAADRLAVAAHVAFDGPLAGPPCPVSQPLSCRAAGLRQALRFVSVAGWSGRHDHTRQTYRSITDWNGTSLSSRPQVNGRRDGRGPVRGQQGSSDSRHGRRQRRDDRCGVAQRSRPFRGGPALPSGHFRRLRTRSDAGNRLDQAVFRHVLGPEGPDDAARVHGDDAV